MRRTQLWALSRILIVGFMIAVLASSSAANAAAKTGCTNHTIQGSYGVAATGFLFDSKGTELADAATVVQATFDGKGDLVDTETASVNGQIASTTATGTYRVSADCTGTATFHNSDGSTNHLTLVIVDGGRQVAFVLTDPGTVLAGTFIAQ